MKETILLPLLGLDNEFPSQLFVLHHPASDRYGCYCHEGIHGLACFSNEQQAHRFAELIDLSGMMTSEVTFDGARDLAKGRPLPVVAILLLDRLEEPLVHYIR
jgi:hypothetical protein